MMTDKPDKLDRLLREDANAALADEGFTARVLGALPPAPARPFPWLKPALVLGSTALGAALALVFAPGDTSLAQGFLDLAHSRLTPSAVTGLAMSACLFLSAIVLAADTE
jgi:hypothetical protein